MMSIRLRLTLLYSAILTLTLILFGLALYTTQAKYTLDSLKQDLRRSSEGVARSALWRYQHPDEPEPKPEGPPPEPPEDISGDQPFRDLHEREIARILSPQGAVVASPPGTDAEALPISGEGMQALQEQHEWWDTSSSTGERLLIYDRPVIADGQVIYIVQAARSLSERDRSLSALGLALIIAILLTTLIAFGIGWVLSSAALRPIHRITQTAQAIGSESDFTRRVDYNGPNDEIGELATTFNSMLTRLQNAYQRVSQALRKQREFVADVSHELRTPLTTIRGNLALLRHDPPPPAEEQADILTDLVDESDRLIRLVNTLLILARADAGRSLLQEPFSVRSVVEEACRQTQHLDPQREIVETVQDVTILGDRDAFKQVLLILLDNAFKYSEGTITVIAEALSPWMALSICDQGPGIAPELLEHVFDRFYRASADPAVLGFGLGLPIARALVEGQDGTISIESQPGYGSIVRVQLPLVPGASNGNIFPLSSAADHQRS